MGNDVFGVLDPSITSGEEASRAATHIRRAFEGPLELPDLSVSVEVSIGAAVVPEDGAEPDLVLLRADVALSVARARSEHTARYGNEMETGGPLVPQLLAELLEAISRATHNIWLTTAYFLPDQDFADALADAARRGVDVRILLPLKSNHIVADWISRGYFSQLLNAGIRIFRFKDAMVHAKTATIDGNWATVGTANIDRLSLQGNYEINLEVIEPGFAGVMEQIFLTDQGRKLAEESRRRHQIVLDFLLSLGIPETVARSDAEGIEHHVSKETLAAFQKAMSPGRPER